MTDEIEWTHHGLFCGIVPVRANLDDPEEAVLEERHWAFIPLFWVVDGAFSAFLVVQSWIDPEFDPAYPLKITRVLDTSEEGW